MKALLFSIRLLAVSMAVITLLAFSCEKDEDDDNNTNGAMWNPDWLIGTWEGTTPATITPWPNTKIRIVFESYTLVEHDTLPGGERKAYAYSGTFTWDLDGTAEWSHQFLSANYPIPDYNVILWDCTISGPGVTVNNISLRVADDVQTTIMHTINFDWGQYVDYAGTAPTSVDFFGDVEITVDDNMTEAEYPPNQGSMIHMTRK